MKILLTCDPEIPVPPQMYGGVERIVDGLAKGYSMEGHEVYLLANPGSTCTYTRINFKWPATHSRGITNIIRNMAYLWRVVNKLKPDAIHSFSRLLYGYPIFFQKKVPFLQTYQRKISPKSTSLALRVAGKKLHFSACAAHMLKGLPNQHAFTPIFNFTDVEYFTCDESVKRGYLMFLGRIENIKGTKEAIEAAIKENCRIIVAGNIQPGHDAYFEEEIEPYLTNPLVEYIGPINDELKKHYLQRAKALLFPIKWEEPFGIVMAEALACGTPIVGYNRGSVPEVIREGENGFIVNNVDEMAAVIKNIPLNSQNIRRDAVTRFSSQNVTRQYLDLLYKIAGH